MEAFNKLICALQKNAILMEALLASPTSSGTIMNNITTSPSVNQIAISSQSLVLNGISVPLSYPVGVDIAYLQLQEGSIIYRVDGSAIENGKGFTFNKRNGFLFFKDLSKIRIVNGSPTASVFITYYKNDI